MEVRARSKAARKVWDTADKFTRETLGFSVLHVVRDNPTSLIASDVHYQHPEGVLYLTQFTQVAMATVAAAQVAEMREQGAFVEGAIACGHSVGEYTAMACVSGLYELEGLLEVVFHRGSKMHDIVPRDGKGRSNYRMAAIRPSQIDLDDADVSTRSPARCGVWRRWRKRSSGAARSAAASVRSPWCPGSTCRSTRRCCGSVWPTSAAYWSG
jgi:fatty acid synthase